MNVANFFPTQSSMQDSNVTLSLGDLPKNHTGWEFFQAYSQRFIPQFLDKLTKEFFGNFTKTRYSICFYTGYPSNSSNHFYRDFPKNIYGFSRTLPENPKSFRRGILMKFLQQISMNLGLLLHISKLFLEKFLR